MAERWPRAGVAYPGSVGELRSWFPTDADCLDYLDWLRWPDGFVCPECGHAGGWWVADGRYKCAGCGGRTSVTAGTLFDRRRTPLTVWFEVCWAFASGKDGISALSLQRTLEIGSYVTAWAMLHRLRAVLVRPGRDRLTGTVEVDETYIGGEEPGLRGGRARGKKVLVCIAIEVFEPRGFGRCRMHTLTDASATSLHAFITDNVEPGAHVITDGWNGYRGIETLGYTHQRRSQRAAKALGEDPGKLLPGVHRVAALAAYLAERHLDRPGREDYPVFFNQHGAKLSRGGIAWILRKYQTLAADPARGSASLSPHILRHSRAMHLYDSGVPLPYIRDILGHVDLSTTEVYARASTDAKRKALEAVYDDVVTADLAEWNQNPELLDWLANL